MKKTYLILVLLSFLFSFPAFSQVDYEGCRDHPLLNRLPGFYIYDCKVKEFDSYKYLTGYDDNGASYSVAEGKYYYISYTQKEGETPYSALQIYRNYRNAILNAGGELVYGRDDDVGYCTFKLKKGDKEIWIGSDRILDGTIDLYIVEVETMKQVISVNEMLLAINNNGFYPLYINFESGKYEIKSEFEPNLNQVVKLLTESPELKISIEGHTDNQKESAKTDWLIKVTDRKDLSQITAQKKEDLKTEE